MFAIVVVLDVRKVNHVALILWSLRWSGRIVNVCVFRRDDWTWGGRWWRVEKKFAMFSSLLKAEVGCHSSTTFGMHGGKYPRDSLMCAIKGIWSRKSEKYLSQVSKHIIILYLPNTLEKVVTTEMNGLYRLIWCIHFGSWRRSLRRVKTLALCGRSQAIRNGPSWVPASSGGRESSVLA